MSINRAELRTQLFRLPGNVPAKRVIASLQSQKQPTAWSVVVALTNGQYGVFTSYHITEALIERLSREPDLLLQAIVEPSPTADAQLDSVSELRSQGSSTGYVVVLRDGEPLGVLMTRRPGIVLTAEALISNQPILQPDHQRTDRYVNTDVCTPANPSQPLVGTQALEANQTYLLRVHIGEREDSSIEVVPSQLPAQLLDRDLALDVVLFSETCTIPQQRGQIRVPAHGPTSVSLPATSVESIEERLLQERLFFQITPATGGQATIRCSFYYHGMLIQSRLITLVVGTGPALDQRGRMQQAVLDFNLSSSLAPDLLTQVTAHRLSLMVNEADGSHQFRLVTGDGKELFDTSATLSSTELQNLIVLGRERLRQAAWGSTAEWANEAYRYEPKLGEAELGKRLREDLIGLARRGAILYQTAIRSLAGGREGQRALRQHMRTPGVVQLAAKRSSNDLLPMALFYDHPIDSQEPNLTICPAFEASLTSGKPLISEPCFTGSCPSHGDLTVVCPSGFWGFRHDIGMPYPVRARGPELTTQIVYKDTPCASLAYFSDFPAGAQHLEALGKLGFTVQKAAIRSDVLKLLRSSTPQLVYFYCHGAEVNTIPFLRVGSNAGQDYLSTDTFANYEIAWPDQRPLVFINGCHTTALTPDRALSFVAAFVDDASAAGVIGTETTIFEPLAQRFAETFLQLFRTGMPFGRAFRAARLELLAERNPLGLVYLPLAYAGLTLMAA